MEALKNPRFWLLAWGGIGAAGLVYLIIAASVQPQEAAPPSALKQNPALLVGEMADFEYAFPPRGAPDIAFDHADGETTLKDFRGKAVLVNFWSTLCLPCIEELPSLNALQEKFGEKRFAVVAIAADPSGPDKARAFLARHHIDALDLYTDQRLIMASAMGANVLPVSILYDAEGREIGRIIGKADWMSQEAVKLVESALP